VIAGGRQGQGGLGGRGGGGRARLFVRRREPQGVRAQTLNVSFPGEEYRKPFLKAENFYTTLTF